MNSGITPVAAGAVESGGGGALRIMARAKISLMGRRPGGGRRRRGVRPRTTPSRRRRWPARLTAGAVAAVIALPLLVVVGDRPAQASFATGGEGRFKGVIDWFEWGSEAGAAIRPGTVTNQRTEGDTTIVTSCTISNITSTPTRQDPLVVYRPGTWRKDGFDNLYNQGGTDTQNAMLVGLANSTNGDTVQFDVSCEMRLEVGGQKIPVDLPGLVVSDAEASGSERSERLEATPLSPGFKTWRVIDRFRAANCASSTKATVDATTNMMRMDPTDKEECESTETPAKSGVWVGGGPTAVGFMEGSTAARVKLQGRAKSAVAVGVVSIIDWVDAPASYGAAGVLAFPAWSGGELAPGTTTDLYDSGFELASLEQPEVRLGALVDGEPSPLHSTDALGDDRDGTADEDLNVPKVILGYRGGSVILNDLVCSDKAVKPVGEEPARVWGWIDFNRNSKFETIEDGAQVNEMGGPVPASGQAVAPAPVQCDAAAGAFSIAWQVPPGAVPQPAGQTTIARIGITTDARIVDQPIGVAVQGELEDHAIDFLLDPYEVVKTSNLSPNSRVGDVITYSIKITTPEVTGVSSGPPATITVGDDLRGLLDDAAWLGQTTGGGAFAFDPGAGQLTWVGAPPPPGSSKELTYRVRLTAGGDGDLKNVAWVDNPGVIPIPACDLGDLASGRDPVTDEPCSLAAANTPRLTIAKTSTHQSSDRSADLVKYTVTVTNQGPGDFTAAAPATVWDDLSEILDDADLVNVSVNVGGGALDDQATADDPLIGWSGPLAAGQSALLTYTVRLGDGGDGQARNVAWSPAPGVLPPVAPACGSSPDPVSGEQCAVVEFGLPRLELDKAVSIGGAGELVVGDQVVFTVTATNTGGADFGPDRPLVLADDLSDLVDGLTYNDDAAATIGAQAQAAPAVDLVTARLAWTGELAVGETVEITYSFTAT
ncbi:MAG: CshA/CshB family fibrillar adhesin-related protein, partial [Bifidobacteriaceae bacterium]|nr:CshA/CshB family fibrillar adhesin-related protein [Bifidobacteriaceae bacterium]